MTDLVKELRGWWNTDHEPDGRGFCKVCSIRSPCDWSQMVDDCLNAADRIEELEAALRDAEEHRVKHLLRVEALETVMRHMAFMSANKVPKDGDTHVDAFLPVAMWKEFRP